MMACVSCCSHDKVDVKAQILQISTLRWCFLSSKARGMFVQVQETPNPNSLKFVPGVQILESGTINFESSGAGHGSPLAR
jgi:hypothetical protein